MEKRHFESEKAFVQASLVDEICVVNFNMNKDVSKVKKGCVTASLLVDEVMCTVFSEGGEETDFWSQMKNKWMKEILHLG